MFFMMLVPDTQGNDSYDLILFDESVEKTKESVWNVLHFELI